MGAVAIQVTPRLSIDDDELRFEFVRASGPGGQNVNKVATACQLRFDARRSPSLPGPVKRRLLRLAGSRATGDGVIVIDARNHRSQARNRAEAVERLKKLVRRAAKPPKPRRRTRPTAASRERRLKRKKRRGELKRSRRPPLE